jgi:hypothetical protein
MDAKACTASTIAVADPREGRDLPAVRLLLECVSLETVFLPGFAAFRVGVDDGCDDIGVIAFHIDVREPAQRRFRMRDAVLRIIRRVSRTPIRETVPAERREFVDDRGLRRRLRHERCVVALVRRRERRANRVLHRA